MRLLKPMILLSLARPAARTMCMCLLNSFFYCHLRAQCMYSVCTPLARGMHVLRNCGSSHDVLASCAGGLDAHCTQASSSSVKIKSKSTVCIKPVKETLD